MSKLHEYIKMDNIAEDLDEQQLEKIGQRVLVGFNEDVNSSSEWMTDVKKVMELASLSTTPKNTPFPDAANVKLPLITKAVFEFAAGAYPEIIKDSMVVKTRVMGKDDDGLKGYQARRVQDFMNYQLLLDSDEWEKGTDKLLNMLGFIGFLCRKTYYDPLDGKNKSIICDVEDLVINSKTKCLEEAVRISHVLKTSLNDAIEQVRGGLYLEAPIKELINQSSAEEERPVVELIEQHCHLDLDEDDYEEPYIVTILKASGKVVRIAPRYTKDDITEKKGKVAKINPIHYFTDYHFLVNPDGSFQSVGFGTLLLHLNESANSIMNMLIDSGKLANLQAGYIDASAKVIDSGNNDFASGELKKLKTSNAQRIQDAVHLIQFKEPSNVLFQLLGLLIQTSKELSSISEVSMGQSGTENTKTGAVLALKEAGMKVLTAIHKRIYRSLSTEFKKLFRLNQMYLDPEVYVNVLDDDLALSQKDFDPKTINVIPVADPNMASSSVKIAKAQFLASTMAFPGVKPEMITRRIYEAAEIENFEALLLNEEEMAQAKQTPNPEVIKVQADIERSAQDINAKHRELDIEEKRVQIEMYKVQCQCLELKAKAMLEVAQAEAQEKGSQMKEYQMQLDVLGRQLDVVMTDKQMQQDQAQHQDTMDLQRRQAGIQEAQNAQPDTGVDAPPSDEGLI